MSKLETAHFFGRRDHTSIRGSVNKVLVIDFLPLKQAYWISQEMLSIPREKYIQSLDYCTTWLRDFSLSFECLFSRGNNKQWELLQRSEIIGLYNWYQVLSLWWLQSFLMDAPCKNIVFLLRTPTRERIQKKTVSHLVQKIHFFHSFSFNVMMILPGGIQSWSPTLSPGL